MHRLSTIGQKQNIRQPLKETTKMLPKNVGRPTSIIRKILLLAFVVGFWVFFYWYQGIEQSNKKPSLETTPPEKLEPLTPKKQP